MTCSVSTGTKKIEKIFKKVKKTVDKLKRLCYTIVRKNKGDTKMAQRVTYIYTFTDGTQSISNYNKAELRYMESKHGKCISIERCAW